MMEIDDEDILRTVAHGGAMDFSAWPALLPRIVSRIQTIAQTEFPIPNLPPAPPTVPSSIPSQQAGADVADNFLAPLPSSPMDSSTSSQDTNKENNPAASQGPSAPSAPTSAPATANPLPPGTLPLPIQNMVTEIAKTLESNFPTYPPHTIQRLSELVLTPKHHYRTLPSYLHALDRVVHVTSGLNVYPLPPAVPDLTTTSLLSNGVSDVLAGPSTMAAPGSDEALGGALLTLIPWLQPSQQPHAPASPPTQGMPAAQDGGTGNTGNSGNGNGGGNDLEGHVRTESTEKIDGPNGMGSIETVSVSVNGIPSIGARGVGVTQGEILRQEQRAGVVPVKLGPGAGNHTTRQVSPLAPSPVARTSPDSAASSATLEEDDGENKGADTGETDESGSASMPAVDEEPPHARGPEEIGAEDMGPQPSGPGTAPANLAQGNTNPMEMHGINIEAAVGRKAATAGDEEKAGEESNDQERGASEASVSDQMDVEQIEHQRRDGSSTPKREAEDDLMGVNKRLKEDSAGDSAKAAETTIPQEAEGDDAASAEEKSGDDQEAK